MHFVPPVRRRHDGVIRTILWRRKMSENHYAWKDRLLGREPTFTLSAQSPLHAGDGIGDQRRLRRHIYGVGNEAVGSGKLC
jgi:hypothetical protein